MDLSDRKHRNLGWIGALLLLASIASIALRSWRAWGDPVVDFPQQLYIAWRIGLGECLYRDIPYVYGPLSQLFNGLLFFLFQPGYLTLTAANLALATGFSLLIYRSIWSAFDWLSGLVAALAFILIHMFQQNLFYNYNFIAPYCHETTHGTYILFSTIVVSAFSQGHCKRWPWHLMGLFCGAALLTKPEILLACSCVAMANFFLERRAPTFSTLKALGYFSIGFLSIVLPVFLYFLVRLGHVYDASLAIGASVTPIFTTRLLQNPLYTAALGTDKLEQNLNRSLVMIGLISAYLMLAAAIDILPNLRWKRYLSLLFLIAVTWTSWTRINAFYFSYAWPILTLLGLIAVAVSIFRKPTCGTSEKFILFLGIASVIFSLKIFFAPLWSWFGFYLLAPGTIFLSVLGTNTIPGFLEKRRGGTFVLKSTTIILLAAISFRVLIGSINTYDQKTLPLGEGSDAIYAYEGSNQHFWASAKTLKDTLSMVQQLSPIGSTLLAIPEGLMINYLLRRQSPTSLLHAFIEKPNYESSGGSPGVVSELRVKKPDYILYLHRVPEVDGPFYQLRGPGGFANPTFEWIETHYHEIGRIGPNSHDFAELQSVLLKRDEP